MNREDIIRMADQSEIDPYDMCEDHRIGVHRLMAFASLVAAAEREACARVCESRQTPGTGSVAILNGAADAIRARGEKP